MNIPDGLMVGGAGIIVIASIMVGIVAYIVKREIRQHETNGISKDKSDAQNQPKHSIVICVLTERQGQSDD